MGRKVLISSALATTLAMLTACSSLGVLNGVTSSAGYVVHRDVAYGPGPRQSSDIYVPAGSSTPTAVVVFFYGGNWREGSKADYRFVAEALAARGVVVVVPDYRLFPEVQYREILRDSASAVAWAMAQAPKYGGDAEQIYLMGHSAGAYNAAMIALDPRWLQSCGRSPKSLAGLIGLAGPYDFLPIKNPDVMPVFGWPQTPADSQPIHHVASSTAPRRSLLIAAHRDAVVDPERNTEGLAKALRQVGAAVQVKRYGWLNHGTTVGSFAWPLRPLAPVLKEVVSFIEAGSKPSAP